MIRIRNILIRTAFVAALGIAYSNASFAQSTISCGARLIETFGNEASMPGAAPGFGPALTANEGSSNYAFNASSAPPGGVFYQRVTSPHVAGYAGIWNNAPDHTGDTGGYMITMDANGTPGVVYSKAISGFVMGENYTFSAAVANLIISGSGNRLLPGASLQIVDTVSSSVLASVALTVLPEGAVGTMPWQQLEIPWLATTDNVRLELLSAASGVVGNDWAYDDVGVISNCVPQPVSAVPVPSSGNGGLLLLLAALTGGGLMSVWRAKRSKTAISIR